ncbi:hypothetical protein DR62_07410 [Burkholderia thailandensis]|nr:hypothetical protein DR62_07410 [Burkholderia thailandensis]AOI54901.1 hypothetical protein WI24_24180 [Burkholderia thailandensis]PJO68757.1 hypothetical protein CWD92_30720 [Burkholderia thailandensis]
MTGPRGRGRCGRLGNGQRCDTSVAQKQKRALGLKRKRSAPRLDWRAALSPARSSSRRAPFRHAARGAH